MKYLKLIIVLVVSALMQACWYTDQGENVGPKSAYRAVTMPRSVLENSIKLTGAKPVTNAGKIYVKDNLMFVTEVNEGFHIYDYADAANPVQKAYLEVPGATDIAIRNNNLYINQAVDLVTLVYDNNAITLGGRTRNIFPQKSSPDGYWFNAGANEIIVNFIQR